MKRRWIAARRIALAALFASGCSSTTTHTEIVPGPSGVLLSPASAWVADPRIGLRRDSALAAALAEVDPTRIRATDSTLVAFGTRNTLSDTLSASRGIGAARRWIHARLEQASRECGGCLRVQYDADVVAVPRHPGGAHVNVVNVLGVLPGRDTNRVVVIGGHYDSCICSASATAVYDTTSDAPGADDDASGTSAVLEVARVVGARYPKGLDATIIFALYAGEEQGLLGSTILASRLEREGKTVVAGMTNDIVGNVVADDGPADPRACASSPPIPTARAAESSAGTSGASARCTCLASRCVPSGASTASDAAATTGRSFSPAGPVFASRSGWRTTTASICPPTISRT